MDEIKKSFSTEDDDHTHYRIRGARTYKKNAKDWEQYLGADERRKQNKITKKIHDLSSFPSVSRKGKSISRLQTNDKQELTHEACTQELHALIDQQQHSSTSPATNTKNSNSNTINMVQQQRRSLPVFKPRENKGGGVIVFWHLAKTGESDTCMHTVFFCYVFMITYKVPNQHQLSSTYRWNNGS